MGRPPKNVMPQTADEPTDANAADDQPDAPTPLAVSSEIGRPVRPPAKSETSETSETNDLLRQIRALTARIDGHDGDIADIRSRLGDPTIPGIAGAGQREKQLPRRQILYHVSKIEGDVFMGDAAIEQAKAAGWVENPAQVTPPAKPA